MLHDQHLEVFLNLTVITHGLLILRHVTDLIVDSFTLKPPQLISASTSSSPRERAAPSRTYQSACSSRSSGSETVVLTFFATMRASYQMVRLMANLVL
ncbi:MAG: hypothetical protein U5Q44_04355 [Dehalococcoidia bacterium]|nr:hypothetical protein [Dehalococcoidia bacterium]